MQLKQLHKKFDELQLLHGDKKLNSIYGAGHIKNPDIMFIFMNPTGKNVSAYKNWKGLRAPWLGTKSVWQVFYELSFISKSTFQKIKELKPENWSIDFAEKIYRELARKRVYITNLAKCTQIDARPLKNDVFKDYLNLMIKEITLVNPKNIITFGNQVSSILLRKQILVGRYKEKQKEILKINTKKFNIYPTYYPVGQGRRNMPLAVKRITALKIFN